MIGADIALAFACNQLAASQQAGLSGLQQAGAMQLQSYYNNKTVFDVKFQEMKRDFEDHLKDWDKPVDNAI